MSESDYESSSSVDNDASDTDSLTGRESSSDSEELESSEVSTASDDISSISIPGSVTTTNEAKEDEKSVAAGTNFMNRISTAFPPGKQLKLQISRMDDVFFRLSRMYSRVPSPALKNSGTQYAGAGLESQNSVEKRESTDISAYSPETNESYADSKNIGSIDGTRPVSDHILNMTRNGLGEVPVVS